MFNTQKTANILLNSWSFLRALERERGIGRIVPMTDAGHVVPVHWSTQSVPSLKGEFPDEAVISLDRLPSHGRAVAEWFWEAKSRRHIPMVLEGGKPEKMAVVRERFPRCTLL